MLVHCEIVLRSFHPRLKINFENLEFMRYMPRNPAIAIWSLTAHDVGRRNSRHKFGQITAYFTDLVDETTCEPTTTLRGLSNSMCRLPENATRSLV